MGTRTAVGIVINSGPAIWRLVRHPELPQRLTRLGADGRRGPFGLTSVSRIMSMVSAHLARGLHSGKGVRRGVVAARKFKKLPHSPEKYVSPALGRKLQEAKAWNETSFS